MSPHPIQTILVFIASAGAVFAAPATPAPKRAPVTAFFEAHCLDCHDAGTRKGGLTIEGLKGDLGDPQIFATWVKIHDRVRDGEMPPKKKPQPAPEERKAFLGMIGGALAATDAQRQRERGRTVFRRLNRVEYENTLRDLLAVPYLEVKEMLPADSDAHGFDDVAEALNLSYVQMNRYLDAAQKALDEAMLFGPKPEFKKDARPVAQQGRFASTIKGGVEAVAIGAGAGVLRQGTSAQTPWWFDNRIFAAGDYRIRVRLSGFLWDKGQVLPADRIHSVIFNAYAAQSSRVLAMFEISSDPAKPTPIEFVTRLSPGERLAVEFPALDDRLKPSNVPLDEYVAPGAVWEGFETEGPIVAAWPVESYRRLFGDLPMEPWTADCGLQMPLSQTQGLSEDAIKRKISGSQFYRVVPKTPLEDARRLLGQFASRAFRRPVAFSELDRYMALVREKLDRKVCFQEALRTGFMAVLCSPDFLFFQETPGRLDEFALAARLSYFLWDTMPDDELLALARRSELSRPAVLRAQTDRLLNDPKSQRFVEDFLGQWLELRRITFTEPDKVLYPEYDALLVPAMLQETHAFFTELLRRDLGVRNVVQSDFAMLNSRLARLYGIPGISGLGIRQVKLPVDSHRGGLLTQASVLKVTANGTTTSPVTRGAWVMDRILGKPLPPPPAGAGSIDPDVRGTTTIREQLDKHRHEESCAVCHLKIDPPGFALESFDPMGGWRTRYRSLGKGDAVKAKPGENNVRYKLGPGVDSSGETPDGRRFQDIDEFKRLLVDDPRPLARNLTEKLLIYGTGAGIQFADRAVIEQILDRARTRDYGLRTLVQEIVQSSIFQQK